MKSSKPTGSFAPHEVQRFILPITLSSIVLMIGLMIEDLLHGAPLNAGLMSYGLIVIVGTIVNHFVITRTADFRKSYGWSNAVLSGIGLGVLPYVLPAHLAEASHILIPIGVMAVTVISGRPYAYTTLILALALSIPYALGMLNQPGSILDLGMPFIVSVILMEAVLLI